MEVVQAYTNDPRVLAAIMQGNPEGAVHMIIVAKVTELLRENGGTLPATYLIEVLKEDFDLPDDVKLDGEKLFRFLYALDPSFELVQPPPGLGDDSGVTISLCETIKDLSWQWNDWAWGGWAHAIGACDSKTAPLFDDLSTAANTPQFCPAGTPREDLAHLPEFLSGCE
mmetsp:Transcript_20141/g.51239  ORF Transcript_20141/g.51239 Transcript_20141/m.51239 type:complete len:169 (+) Transcript_20141:39-545(+)